VVDPRLHGGAIHPWAVRRQGRHPPGRAIRSRQAARRFAELATLHGDKAVWKLLDRHAARVVNVPVPGTVPADVDTWEDDEALLATAEPAA
jgi:CTP:molybdopterin cytidylyltransferase MocA